MKLTTSTLDNVSEIELITATSTYGIGFITGIVFSFCHLLGWECKRFNRKVESAKESAKAKLIAEAEKLAADGVMNVRFQLSGLSVFVYGTAFKLGSPDIDKVQNDDLPEI